MAAGDIGPGSADFGPVARDDESPLPPGIDWELADEYLDWEGVSIVTPEEQEEELEAEFRAVYPDHLEIHR